MAGLSVHVDMLGCGFTPRVVIPSSDVTAPSATLLLHTTGPELRAWPLTTSRAFLVDADAGRSDGEVTLSADPASAERARCRFERLGEVTQVADQGTPAGLFVNETRCREATLADQDIVRSGRVVLHYFDRIGPRELAMRHERLRYREPIAATASLAALPRYLDLAEIGLRRGQGEAALVVMLRPRCASELLAEPTLVAATATLGALARALTAVPKGPAFVYDGRYSHAYDGRPVHRGDGCFVVVVPQVAFASIEPVVRDLDRTARRELERLGVAEVAVSTGAAWTRTAQDAWRDRLLEAAAAASSAEPDGVQVAPAPA